MKTVLQSALKWLFGPRRAAAPPPQAPSEADATDLRARIIKLEHQAAENVDLKLEWAEVLDKLQRWTNRQSARDAARLKSGLHTLAETAQDAPGATNGGGGDHEPARMDRAAQKAALRAKISNGGRA